MSDPNHRSVTPGPLARPAARPDGPALWNAAALVLGLVGLFACLVFLGILAQAVRTQEAIALDALATPFFHAMASPTLDAVMNGASFIGSDVMLLPLLLVVVAYLAWRGHRREALFMVLALGGSLLVNGAMKLFFHRARPELAWANVLPDFSFPSGHSMNSVVFFVGLALVTWRLRGARWGAAATAVAVLLSVVIGISRIYLGYHYLTDVLGGFAAGILWLAIVVAVFRGQALTFGRRSRGREQRPRPS